MNTKHQENGALTGPLIFTLPGSSFVVVLGFDWHDESDRAAVSAKTLAHRLCRSILESKRVSAHGT